MNLFYLSLISFVFIATSAISLGVGNFSEVQKKIVPWTIKASRYSDIPLLSEDVTFPILSSQSVMAIDLDSGVTLYEKDPLRALFPASTTKIATALVVLDEYDLEDVVRIQKPNKEGQSMNLVYGEEITVENLLEAMLIYSANDAAEALAQFYPEGREEFINLMNQKVESLGLINTHFTNPSGFDDPNQFSNVRDLTILSREAIKNVKFLEIVGTKEKEVTDVSGKIVHNLKNTNELLGSVDGVAGVKTGWTEAARENLVTYIRRDGRNIMIAVLGSQDRFGETKELIDWIFENYSWKEVYYSP